MTLVLLWLATAARSTPAPQVDAATAIEAALAALPAAEARAELSDQPIAGGLRRVWSVHLDRPFTDAWIAPIVRIDPDSGLVLRIDEGAVDVGPVAHVYPHNPVVDAEPVEVHLEGAEYGLSNDRLEVRQCRDLGETTPAYADDGTVWDLHVCTEVPALGPRPDTDYVYPPIPWPWKPGRDEDHFAASHLYWTVGQGLDWFEALGWVSDPSYDARVDVVANRRVTDLLSVANATDPDRSLYTYDNAYHQRGWLDWEDNWVAPRLVFGQGSTIDYAYDTDVVIHELAHLIVSSSLGPSWSADGSHGPRVEANALNEAIADYFACAFMGEPRLAEYAGAHREQIRALDGDATCRRDLYGEPHYDSLPVSQGLWEVRESLAPADQRLLDQAVLDSLPTMGQMTDFAEAFTVVPAAVDARLGVAVGDALREVWRERGVDDCVPIIDVKPSDEPVRSFTMIPAFFEYSELDLIPGYVQFRVDVPEPETTVRIRASQLEFLGLDLYGDYAVGPVEVVGSSAPRITWTHKVVDATFTTTTSDGGAASFNSLVTDWRADAVGLGALEETGTRPYDALPDRYLVHDYELELVIAKPGPFVFQFVNEEERAITLRDLTVTVTPPGGRDGERGVACGCATDGSTGAAPLGWVALLMLRRRRTR